MFDEATIDRLATVIADTVSRKLLDKLPKPEQADEHIGLAQAAKMLGVCQKTMRRKILSGGLATRRIGRKMLFSKKEIQAALDTGKLK